MHGMKGEDVRSLQGKFGHIGFDILRLDCCA